MSKEDIKGLAKAYIEHCSNAQYWDENMVLTEEDSSTTEWAMDKVFDITYENPEELWDFILEVLDHNPPNEVIEILAAGPLEDYLAKCGETVIERVEEQAAKDERFKGLLGGVWKNSMTDEVWSRVQACWDRSGWDNAV